MQWLINIIKEVIHGQLGYFDRGDPVNYDFLLADFTRNNAWHELDLSSIVPEGAVAVLFFLRIKSPDITKSFSMQKNGNVNAFARTNCWVNVANVYIGGTQVCSCDSDRKVLYRASVDPWIRIDLVVCGWWLR